MFRIDPTDPQVAYAGCPSEDQSSKRLNLLREEADRLLPQFVRDVPGVAAIIDGRRLDVRFENGLFYDADLIRREVPGWEYHEPLPDG